MPLFRMTCSRKEYNCYITCYLGNTTIDGSHGAWLHFWKGLHSVLLCVNTGKEVLH